MSKVGMGVIYTLTATGKSLRAEPSKHEKRYLINSYYYPHHDRLEKAVDRSIDMINKALIIDCHSFPSKPLPYELNQNTDRPDICIGTDNFHTSKQLSNALVKQFFALGYTVKINEPFSGSLVPNKFYSKDKRVQSVMIEINRKLYMDEYTGQKVEHFDKLESNIEKVLAHIQEEFI